MKESAFQSRLIKELREMFEYDDRGNHVGFVWKTVAFQGMPDIIILYKNKWATLEAKKSIREVADISCHEPNQDYYVNLMNNLSFSSFICPETKEEVLDELQRSFSI